MLMQASADVGADPLLAPGIDIVQLKLALTVVDKTDLMLITKLS